MEGKTKCRFSRMIKIRETAKYQRVKRFWFIVVRNNRGLGNSLVKNTIIFEKLY
jgi:hypothetical protein